VVVHPIDSSSVANFLTQDRQSSPRRWSRLFGDGRGSQRPRRRSAPDADDV